jgi:transposase-like protein
MSTNPPRGRREFTRGFKARLWRWSTRQRATSRTSLESSTSVYDPTLVNWVLQARDEAAGGPTVAERAEIRKFNREPEWLRRERDIVRTAVDCVSASARRTV